VPHHVADELPDPRRRVVQGDQRVVALEVVGRHHAVVVVQALRPVRRRRSRAFGQGLGHRRELPARVVEHSVEKDPDATVVARRHQPAEVVVAAEPRIDLEVVDRVVAVAGRGENRS
jgi:hypothetical protein